MVKADLARSVYEAHGGLTHQESKEMVKLILDSIKSELLRGENVKLSGFGSFRVISLKARRGRNPQTRAQMQLGPSRRVTFRPSRLINV